MKEKEEGRKYEIGEEDVGRGGQEREVERRGGTRGWGREKGVWEEKRGDIEKEEGGGASECGRRRSFLEPGERSCWDTFIWLNERSQMASFTFGVSRGFS